MGWGICLNVTSKKRASVFSHVGHYFPIPQNAPSKVKKARERSLGVHGAHVFNLLPTNIRNENSGDFPLFKNHLDLFLGRIPEQPTTPGLVRAALTNSLLDQVPLVPDIY